MTVEEFYEEQTSLKAKKAPRRIREIISYMVQHKLSLDEIKLVQNRDYKWNERSNRTKNERMAMRIGQTNSTMGPYPLQIWWLMPK